MAKILTIEDEENLRFSICRSLRKAGHSVHEADRAEDAWRLSRENDFDVILTDVNLAGDESGVDLLKRLRGDDFDGAVILITAYGDVEKAVDAMRHGADDYLQKPVGLEELGLIIDREIEHRRTRNRLQAYERIEAARDRASDLIGENPTWREMITLAERLSEMPLPGADGGARDQPPPAILILGETGAGKGVVARHIHRTASAKLGDPNAPFIHVNCAALPAPLVESELFGHERGAFTDAKASRAGLFEMAEGGTIFLDEIGDMPADLQAKILLVVERGAFRRVGGARDRRANVRLVAATNQDLAKAVEDGSFRRDLYYRLNAFTLPIPPLRDRPEDILPIAEGMLDRFGRQFGRPGRVFGPAAIGAMKRHNWPGNVRELINVVQRAVMLGDEREISPKDIGLNGVASRKAAAPAPDANGRLIFDFEHHTYTAEEVERELIIQALERARGNVSRAARLIGMNRSSLRYRIERAGLEDLVREMAQR
ncbi:MAG: sigma-54 dependent transcriptional regulator [Phycisphaerales bacterium]